MVISSNFDTIIHLCLGSRHGQQTNMRLQSLWRRRSLKQKEKRKNIKMKNKNRVDEEYWGVLKKIKLVLENFWLSLVSLISIRAVSV